MTRSVLLEKEAPPPAKNEVMIGLLASNRPVADSFTGVFGSPEPWVRQEGSRCHGAAPDPG